MNNETLFQRIKKLVATERRIGIEILECLYEIEQRKAYAELKYDGLYTYCIRELGFSDGQAYQRIQAMRALKSIPELKPMIESGTLTVSSVSKVQTHLRAEARAGKPASKEEGLKIFSLVQNCTTREVDKKLAEVKGEAVREKLVLELDPELKALWTEAKNRSGHKTQGQDCEILKMLLESWLKVSSSKERKDAGTTRRTVPTAVPLGQTPKKSSPEFQRTVPWSTRVTARYVPADLKREVYKQCQNKCANCDSRFALEIDHIRPFAHGGKTELENLRLLCRNCNRFAAIQVFGVEKIKSRV